MGPNRIDDDNAARYSCEYRHIGERMALLTVELRTGDPAPPADARLQIGTAELAPAATAVHAAAGFARLVFVVGRDEEAHGRTSLSLALGSDAERVVLPPPRRRAPVSAPEGDIDEVVASVLNGEQLFGVVALLEKRCTTAERVAADLRDEQAESRKMAQAWRESWELREMLESRESAYREGAAAVQAAEATRLEYETEAAAARTERDDLRGELHELRAAAARREAELEGAALALDERLEEGRHAVDRLEGEVTTLRGELAATIELADASEAVRVEQAAETTAAWQQLEDLRTEFERRIEELEAEVADRRDSIGRLEADLAERRAAIDRLEAEVAAARGERDRARDDARRMKHDLAASVDLARTAEQARAEQADEAADAGAELDEARTTAARLRKEAEVAQAAAADAEGRLDRERALYEGRIGVSVESETRMRAELEALKAEVAELRRSPRAAVAPQPTDARRVTVEDQRAQVAALERQLEEIKQRSASRRRDGQETGPGLAAAHRSIAD